MYTADIELTPDVFTRAIEANLYETFVFLGSSIGEVIKADGTVAFFTGLPIPMFNGVVSPQFTTGNADTYIDFFIDQARIRGVPMMWQVGPSSEPFDVGDRLTAHGFVPGGEVPSMAVDLLTLDQEAPPEGVFIRKILDLDHLRTAVTIMCDVFGIPQTFLDALLTMVAAGGTSEGAAMVHYAAWIDGEMVSVSTVAYASGVAGIYNVATLESYRRRGIGRAITLAPLLDARSRGCRIGILQSSDMGLSTYRKLGFQRYGQFRTFVWTGDDPANAEREPEQ